MMNTKRADGNSFTGAHGRWVGLALAGMLILGGLGLDSQAAVYTNYVAQAGQTPVPNYTNWMTAASNIQDAVDVALVGNTVLVSNGVYNTGSRSNCPSYNSHIAPCRVVIMKAVTVRSVSGDPSTTIIQGSWASDGSTNGPGSVRCVGMQDTGASLIGFTLANGSTPSSNVSPATYDTQGGGLLARSAALISNCVIVGNSAGDYGGAVRTEAGVVLYNCMIVSNLALRQSGGVYGDKIYNCTFRGNQVIQTGGEGGGAVSGGTLYNCLLIGNRSQGRAGGATSATLYNCTVSGNYAAGWGGGVTYCSLYNCIVYGNDSPSGSNYNYESSGYIVSNCCISPSGTWTGSGNITNLSPRFVVNGTNFGLTLLPGDYHLAKGSPCIDKGLAFSWMTNGASAPRDLDGNSRIRGLYPDMGAYESAPPPGGSLLMLR